MSQEVPSSVCFLLAAVAGWMVGGILYAVESKPIFRDLPASFGQHLCASTLTRQAQWDAGIFDAQIEGVVFQSRLGPVNRQHIDLQGITLAQSNHFAAYSGGVCSSGAGWVVALPAVAGIVRADPKKQFIEIPEPRGCATFALYSVAAGGDVGKKLRYQSNRKILRVNTNGLPAGTLSVTCKPARPRWASTQLLYLMPIGSGPLAVVPQVGLFDSANPDRQKFTAWINTLRRKEGLPSLVTLDALDRIADSLSVGEKVAHDLQRMSRQIPVAEGQGLTLLGEDRAKAATIQEAAWLLWNSPLHRNLLLDRNATHLGFEVRRDDDLKVMVVLVTAVAKEMKQVRKNRVSRPKRI